MALRCLCTVTFPTSPGAESRGWPPGSADGGWVQGVVAVYFTLQDLEGEFEE